MAERTNADRIADIDLMLKAGGYTYDPETVLIDLLTNLRHWARQHMPVQGDASRGTVMQLSFDAAVRISETHFEAEFEETDEEVARV